MRTSADKTRVKNVNSNEKELSRFERHSSCIASNCNIKILNHENRVAKAGDVSPPTLMVKGSNCRSRIVQITKSFASHFRNSLRSVLEIPSSTTWLVATEAYAMLNSNVARQINTMIVYPDSEFSGQRTHSPS